MHLHQAFMNWERESEYESTLRIRFAHTPSYLYVLVSLLVLMCCS